jgi:hypothetical protein
MSYVSLWHSPAHTAGSRCTQMSRNCCFVTNCSHAREFKSPFAHVMSPGNIWSDQGFPGFFCLYRHVLGVAYGTHERSPCVLKRL